MYWTGLDSAITSIGLIGVKVYASHMKYAVRILIYKKRILLAKQGLHKKKVLTPPQLSDEEETANAEIPQVARFRPRVCRTPARRGSCVVGSEETYEDEEVPAGFKEETLTTASRFGNNGAGARHQGLSQGLS